MRRIFSIGGAIVASAVLALSGMAAADTPPSSTDTDSNSSSSILTIRVPVIVTLKAEADATEVREDVLLAQQEQLLSTWKDKYGVEVDRQFGLLLSGFSATMPSGSIAALSRESTVLSVREQRVFYPTLDTAGDMVQVGTVWDDLGVDGTGMVISIIDSGIDPSHQDMRLTDPTQAKISEVKSGGQFTAKVPWGYNFADRNENILDTGSSQHGMHVAGIAAANGGPDASIVGNGHANGMAPEAQLLAMKVFSNDSGRGGAFEADLVAAVEESVRQGADIINMSLGSANGFDSADYGLNRAIENATEQGVLVVVAAGNEGLRSSPDGTSYDLDLYKDNGTVGGPSTSKSSFSVASIENSNALVTTAELKYGTDQSVDGLVYEAANGSIPQTAVTLWDGGLGAASDLTGVSGKWALIKRGDLSFTAKVDNAGAAGAAGVVLWNHEDGGDSPFGIVNESTYDIPVVTMGNADGATIAAKLATDPDATLLFGTDVSSLPNSVAGGPSSFTSWGTTPDLSFKPEIAGIGGKVYSTQNGDSYANMSGTSMASPQVAGLSALVVSSLRDRFPDLDNTEINTLTRTVLSNTAERAVDGEGIPYPTRQQGAGLVQVGDALATDVTVTSVADGAPNLALRDFTEAQEFSVTLKNLGDAERSFAIDIPAVLTEALNDAEELAAVQSDHGDVVTTAESSVVVPAGGEVTVDFTLSVGDVDEARFVEGWVDFVSQDAVQPDLSIPYMGFVGNWGAEAVFDTGIWAQILDYPSLKTQLAVDDGSTLSSYDENEWYSPEFLGSPQTMIPVLFSLRNATEIRYELVDTEGNLIQTIGYDREVVAPLISSIIEGGGAYNISDWRFDGWGYDKATGDYAPVESGDYVFRTRARVNDNADWQVYDFPFKLETSQPVIEVLDIEDRVSEKVMTVKVTDPDSGPMFLEATTAVNQIYPDPVSVDETTAVYEVVLEYPDYEDWALLNAYDFAGNQSEPLLYFVNEEAVIWTNSEDLARGFSDSSYSFYLGEPLVQDGKVPFVFFAADGVKSIKVAGVEAEINEYGEFIAWVPVEPGRTTVALEAFSASNTLMFDDTAELFYHPWAPTLSDVVATPGVPGKINVSGCVSDRILAPQDIRVDLTMAWPTPGPDGCFTAAARDLDEPLTRVYVSNGVTDITDYFLIEGRQVPSTWDGLLKGTNVNFVGGVHIIGHTDPRLTETEGAAATYEIVGAFTVRPAVFKIDGRDVQIDEDLSFSHTVTLNDGMTSVNVYLEAADGTVVSDTSLSLLYSPSLPSVGLDSPVIVDGQIFVPAATDNPVKFTGVVEDETFGEALLINGDVVTAYTDITAPGTELTRKTFEYDAVLNAGDTVTINVLDALSRQATLRLPVVLDDVDPVLSIGMEDGDAFAESTSVSVAGTDQTLSTFQARVYAVSDPDTAVAEIDTVRSEGADGVTFSGTFDPYELEHGQYFLDVVAVDAAGNLTSQTVMFYVDKSVSVTIEGPESIEIEDGQAINLVDYWSVPDGYQLTADLSALALGTNVVKLQALDAGDNSVAEKNVVIKVIPAYSTLTAERVSVTARFNPEDVLSATWTTVSETVEEFTVDHGGNSLQGVLEVEVPRTEGVKVLRIADAQPQTRVDGPRALADLVASREVIERELRFEVGDGTLKFEGATPGTYRIVYPAVPGPDGGKEPGPAGPGSKDKGPGGISATGANGIEGAAVWAVGLVAAGAGALYLARRRGSARGGRSTEA